MSIKSTLLKARQLKNEKINPNGLDFASMKQIAEIVAQDAWEKARKELTEEIMSSLIEIQQRTIKGDKGRDGRNGKDGYTPQRGVDYFDGRNGEDGKDGADGKDAVIDYAPIIKEVSKIVPELDTPIQIADKLNTLTEKVDRKVIKGLEQWMISIKALIKGKMGSSGGGGGMGNWITESPSGATNDLNTTFTLTNSVASKDKAIILLYQGQVLEWGNQFTISGRTITTQFVPETGTTLFAMYVRG